MCDQGRTGHTTISEKAKYALMIDCETESLSAENIVQNNSEGEVRYQN